jgi:hypothetical protein
MIETLTRKPPPRPNQRREFLTRREDVDWEALHDELQGRIGKPERVGKVDSSMRSRCDGYLP